MDFSTLTDDELAAAGSAWFAELEARIGASELPVAADVGFLVRTAHRILNRVRTRLVDHNVIQPFSGGIPKPEGD